MRPMTVWADIVDLWNENVWLAARGGGIGSYWGIYARLVRRLVKMVKPPALCRSFVLWTV